MRINNEIRNYVRNAVEKKATTKRNEIVEEIIKLKKSYDKKLKEKKDNIKAKLKQICDVARAEIVEYAKSVDCKMVNSDNTDFVSPNTYDIDIHIVASGFEKVDEAEKRLRDIDTKIDEVVEEILFKLSLGGDYDSVVKEINNIKF